jgi:hypothetical protein
MDDFGAPIDPLDPLDYWRLCDELSVVQAALLIVGRDPSGVEDGIDLVRPSNRPTGYNAAKAALINAVNGKRLAATELNCTDDGGWSSRPEVEDLRVWFKARGIKTGFVFAAPEASPDYLSEFHPNYSPKLAAAIEAWKAVSGNIELRRGKSVKQALIDWLRQHANEFGLTKEDGNPHEQGIEEVAKIASWDTRGGLHRTSTTKKARELKETEIALQMEQHQKSEGDFRTTLESLISLASRVAELFERSKTEQKRQLIAFVVFELTAQRKKVRVFIAFAV